MQGWQRSLELVEAAYRLDGFADITNSCVDTPVLSFTGSLAHTKVGP